ncbi:uncharacterized protein LOC132613146 [Lycium barbarum]|uniref:uncharacterized protein LOC132613146 n=1 Tax=Lycium barbarum TaxID=112863 RepID=UPI00293F1C04|nr:uncharacterized protein LOC132613146 [Lycium barbarum]
MTRSSSKELTYYDPEIERSIRLRWKEQTSTSQSVTRDEMEHQEGVENHPPGIPPPLAPEDHVRNPPVVANNFETRTGLIQKIQQSCTFTGDLSEDPHSHLIDFLELVETAKYNGVSPETDTESVYYAWEILKAMLRKCPHHDIAERMQLYIFYHGLKPSSRKVIDAAAGGSIMGKSTEEALQMMNEISENSIQWPSDRLINKKAATVIQADALNTLTQQIASLAQKFEFSQENTQKPSQAEACDICGGNRLNHECQASNQNDEQVNAVGYKPYSFGSPLAQKHPGFQWSNPNGAENSQRFQKQQVQGPPGYQNQNRGPSNFRSYQQLTPYQQRPQQAHMNLDDLLYKYIKSTDEKMESQNSALKNLEIQLSQLATLVSEKIQCPLPSNTQKNPKENLKAISLQSGKNLDEPFKDTQERNQSSQHVDKGKNVESPSEQSEEKEKKMEEENILPVKIPFPQKMKREKLDSQFSKFLDILKQIHINIPFTYALLQMPSYAKFLKEILSSKRKLDEAFVVVLTKNCSSILQNKLPQKLGDPGSFTIPCTLGGVYFEKALCDSGASINLMPFSIFRKLDLGEIKNTSVSLQFADQSTKNLRE